MQISFKYLTYRNRCDKIPNNIIYSVKDQGEYMAYFKVPSGVQDLLPEECYNLNLIKNKLESKFLSAGCKSVLSPAIEYYDTFASINNAIPQENMFKMTDRNGKLLVLRPDVTLAIARIAATKLKERNIKLSYVADVWNYHIEKAEVNQREYLQAGVEFLGVSNPFSDAQTIAFAIECLIETGIKDFIIDLSHVGFFKGVLSDANLKESEIEDIRKYVNAKDGVGVEMVLNASSAGDGAKKAIMAFSTLFGGEEVFDRAEKLTDNEAALNSLNHLKKVYSLLKEFGYEKYVFIDLGTVKNLAYYSGVVFTGYVKNFGFDVLSGGRYDNLCDEFGKKIPAVGFAMGLKRALVILERQGSLKKQEEADVIIISEEGCEDAAYSAYKKFVAEGKRADLFTGNKDEALNYIKGKNSSVYVASFEGGKEL